MRIPVPGELREFATLQPDVEAVIQRCGLDTYDLLLIDLDGNWTRWVFPSEEAAESVAGDLGVPLHHGWDDHRLTRRVLYQAIYNSSNGLVTWTETWSVPPSSTPVTLSQVRASTTEGGSGTGPPLATLSASPTL